MCMFSLLLHTHRTTPKKEGKTMGVGLSYPILFSMYYRNCQVCYPYLPCWLHLHRELGGGEESRGWMQSLGVHGAQGGLQRTESEPEAAWGSP